MIDHPELGGGVCVTTFIRISNRWAVFSKWAQMLPPSLLPAAYAFHEFAYAVGEQKIFLAQPLHPNLI